MAAVTLTPPFPAVRKQASVGTTLQEFVLPRGCRKVTVQADAKAWVQFTGSDGGTVSTTQSLEIPVANGWVEFSLAPGHSGSVLAAAHAGTCTIYVVCEGA